jgi:DNA-directed RNA polymerase subunit RPC12/RpoP
MGHVPTHGPVCTKVRSHRTKCPDCKRQVQYFECSCGSKVFLELGRRSGEHVCLPDPKPILGTDAEKTCPYCSKRVKTERYLRHIARCCR